MRYLPFIVISIILYALFFYNNQHPTLTPVAKTDNNKQVIPLDFTKVSEQDAQVSDQKIAAQSPAANTAALAIEEKTNIVIIEKANKVLAEKRSLPMVQINPQLKLQQAIKQTTASEAALLKALLFEEDFHLDSPAPPAVAKASKKQSDNVVKKSPSTATKTGAKKIEPKKPEAKIVMKSAPTSGNKSVVQSLPLSEESALTESVSSVIFKQSQTMSAPELPKEEIKETATTKRSFKKAAPENIANSSLPQAIAVSGNKPTYPKQAISNKQQGLISIKLTVSMQGKGKDAQIIQSTGHKVLDDAALDFIDKERFMPKLEGAEKVTSEQIFSFDFKLK